MDEKEIARINLMWIVQKKRKKINCILAAIYVRGIWKSRLK